MYMGVDKLINGNHTHQSTENNKTKPFASNLDPKCGAIAIIVIHNCGAVASNVAQNVEPLPLIWRTILEPLPI